MVFLLSGHQSFLLHTCREVSFAKVEVYIKHTENRTTKCSYMVSGSDKMDHECRYKDLMKWCWVYCKTVRYEGVSVLGITIDGVMF